LALRPLPQQKRNQPALEQNENKGCNDISAVKLPEGIGFKPHDAAGGQSILADALAFELAPIKHQLIERSLWDHIHWGFTPQDTQGSFSTSFPLHLGAQQLASHDPIS